MVGSGVNSSVTVYGKQYLATGDFTIRRLFRRLYVFQQKALKTETSRNHISVRDGKYSTNFPIIKDAAEDLNGDGVFDENDFYGYVANLALLST